MTDSAAATTTHAIDSAAPEASIGTSPQRAAVFGLTWCAYAGYYFGRKSLSVTKSHLQERLGVSLGVLGGLDTAYLTAYAIGQFVNGTVGDRVGPRRLIGWGMLLVAGCCATFGLAEPLARALGADPTRPVLAGLSAVTLVFLVAYTLNGYFQSTCYQAGGLAATAVATWLFVHYGWNWAFVGPAILIAAVGLANLLFLPERRPHDRPRALGPDAPAATADASPAGRVDVDCEPARVSVLRSPVLWSLGASYFCLKLIRYSLLFWLPYYLNTVLGYTKAQAGYQSISFEVGGILGAIVVGLISDRYFPGRRRGIAAFMVAMLAASLLVYIRVAPISGAANFLGMSLVGFCLFGPDTLICGTAAQDVGGKRDVAKAAGFINGMGSVGAIFQGVVTTGVSSRFGWNALFYTFVALALLSSVALLVGRRPATSPAG